MLSFSINCSCLQIQKTNSGVGCYCSDLFTSLRTIKPQYSTSKNIFRKPILKLTVIHTRYTTRPFCDNQSVGLVFKRECCDTLQYWHFVAPLYQLPQGIISHTSGSLIFSMVIRRRDVWLDNVCSQLLTSRRHGWRGTISSQYLGRTQSRVSPQNGFDSQIINTENMWCRKLKLHWIYLNSYFCLYQTTEFVNNFIKIYCGYF